MDTITLYRAHGHWIADFGGFAAPTPYRDSVSADVVLAAVAKLNPDSEILISKGDYHV